MKIHSKQGNQPNPHIVWHQKCEISIKIPLMTAKKCKISSSSSPNLEKNWNLGSGPNVVLALESFTYYVSNVYVPRVRANADQVLTTPPRVSRDPKKCWRNMWTAPYTTHHNHKTHRGRLQELEGGREEGVADMQAMFCLSMFNNIVKNCWKFVSECLSSRYY